MTENPVATAARTLVEGVGQLRAAAGPDSSEETRIGALSQCESLLRQIEHVQAELLAGLDRDGAFLTRCYRSSAHAVADLLGWDTGAASRRMRVADQVCPRTGLDGQPLPARMPATAAVFAAGEISLRHVEVIAEALRTAAASRLDPVVWAGAEAELAEQARLHRPAELVGLARDLITALDQDGPEPDESDPPDQVNELRFNPCTGVVRGELDGYTRELLATALGALTLPAGPEDRRATEARNADALGELCRHALDRGALPETGGERPHLSVLIPLAELERRARTAWLDFGSTLHPADLRMAACDARVVPVVLGDQGQALDVGRARRTVPDALRRAVTARDRGCAFPGCGRPPSWCEIHHVIAWENGGATALDNCAMLCRFHHRLIHHDSGWIVRIRDGSPEFVPPKWIDGSQIPRRRPPPIVLRGTGSPACAGHRDEISPSGVRGPRAPARAR